MASINGISIKALKEFKGHEGEPLLQGNIYYKGKKVGFWSQDSWGGEDNINIDYDLDMELKREINNILDNYEDDTIFGGISKLYEEQYNVNFKTEHKFKGSAYLFEELITLKEHEDTYKKCKQMWGINTIAICYKDLFTTMAKGTSLNRVEYEKKLQEDNEIKLYYIYCSEKDFDKVV